MMRAAKKDANHVPIVNAFEKLGCGVVDLSDVGRGVPDLLVWASGLWHLVDIKNPETGYGKRGLNPRQKKWAEEWRGGPVYLVYTVADVVLLANGKTSELKCFPDEARKQQQIIDDMLKASEV